MSTVSPAPARFMAACTSLALHVAAVMEDALRLITLPRSSANISVPAIRLIVVMSSKCACSSSSEREAILDLQWRSHPRFRQARFLSNECTARRKPVFGRGRLDAAARPPINRVRLTILCEWSASKKPGHNSEVSDQAHLTRSPISGCRLSRFSPLRSSSRSTAASVRTALISRT